MEKVALVTGAYRGIGLEVTRQLARRGFTAVLTAREHRRRGYASEAALLVLKYYFDELRYQKCLVNVHANNPASAALHEKLGFVLEGTLRREVYTGGRFHDLHYYGMLKEEWEQSPLKI